MKAIGITSLIASTTLLMGCASAQDVSGTMSIPSLSAKDVSKCMWSTLGGSEFPENVYPDIAAGTPVELKNSSGEIVGIANLGQGEPLFGWSADGIMQYDTTDEFVRDYCVFPFTFEQADLTDEFYTVEVGTRGEVNFTKQDLIDGVSLSLGD